jgi:hypothetical protein
MSIENQPSKRARQMRDKAEELEQAIPRNAGG